MRNPTFLVLLLGSVQRIVEHADLPPERRDLLVQQLDPRQRIG